MESFSVSLNILSRYTVSVTLLSLSLRACLAALSLSPAAVSQACLASALDSWTTLSVFAGYTSFPASSVGASHDLFCVEGTVNH